MVRDSWGILEPSTRAHEYPKLQRVAEWQSLKLKLRKKKVSGIFPAIVFHRNATFTISLIIVIRIPSHLGKYPFYFPF